MKIVIPSWLSTWLFLLPALAWSAFVVSVLWAWFVAPVTGLPALTIATALGLRIFWLHMSGFRHGSSEPISWEQVRNWYGLPAVSLVFGFLAHTLVGWGH